MPISSHHEPTTAKSITDGSETDSTIDRKDMRYFIYYPPKKAIRLIDVAEHVLVEDVLQLIKDEFGLNMQDSGPEETSIVLNYNGSDLKPEWSLTDLSIPSGAMIRCIYREIKAADLYVHCGFNKQILKLFDASITLDTTMLEIRKKISKKIGLPLSTFCLERLHGEDRYYDEQRLMDYDLKIHDHVYLKVWRGYEKLINSCVKGFTETYSSDDLTRHYQTQIALYIAAFYGHMELASSVMQLGARTDRPVGEHPSRQWSSETTMDQCPEMLQCPIHIAIERGHVKMVDLFVRQSVLCTQVRDPVTGFLPFRLALSCSLKATVKEEKQRYRVIHYYLHDKQYNLRIPLNATGDIVTNLLASTVTASTMHRTSTNYVYISLARYCRIISWYERAREKAWKKYGGRFYQPPQPKRVYPKRGLLGYQVLIDGYNHHFEVPSEATRMHRSNATEHDVLRIGFTDAEREKMAQMKTYIKQMALDDRTRAKQIAAANLQQSRRQPMFISQTSSDSQKQSGSSSSEVNSSLSGPSPMLSQRTNISVPNLKLFQSNLSAIAGDRSTQRKPNPVFRSDRSQSDHQRSRRWDSMSTFNSHTDLPPESIYHNRQEIPPVMSSVDAYTFSTTRRAMEIEHEKAMKRQELFLELEQSVQNQPDPIPARPTKLAPNTRRPAMDSGVFIPLPEHPTLQRSSPIKSRLDYDIHQSTVKPYERYASASTRKTAVNCLQEAGFFKGKSWLRQVELSKEMVKHRVKRRIRRAAEPTTPDANLTANIPKVHVVKVH